ncbi:MAG TPA: hypothetical protein VKB49_05550 [Candidatus Sulfotelmatobacter sp.]|nr:hypothetical protein [Candidatus Sulfotelmatobacter sp.]
MTTERTHDPMLWSTIAIATLLAVTAVAGLFWPATYARETPISRVGGYASDIVDLFLVLPVVLISGIRGYRGSVPARLVWLGAQGYLFYNFVIYAFGVHFNALFLIYCATLSLCVYAAIFSLPLLSLEQIAQTYGPGAPRITIGAVFLVIAIQTATSYVRDDMAAIVAGRVPQDILDSNQAVNFIHVLDLAFLLPALCIAAILLFRRKASGYALAPALLTLLAIMSMELVSIFTTMGRAGFGMNVPMIIFFAALGVVFTSLLWFYFFSARRTSWTGAPSQAQS